MEASHWVHQRRTWRLRNPSGRPKSPRPTASGSTACSSTSVSTSPSDIARLVSGVKTDEAAIDDATIEAVWVFLIPMSLPLDARLPEAQVKHARQALARAKMVGEEYAGVHVATAIVRTRRAGYAIVDEARRRGVEAIVLGAEEPSLVRGGARLGGSGGRLENFVGDVTKYVVSKAECRVIVTAPPARKTAEQASLQEHRAGAGIV